MNNMKKIAVEILFALFCMSCNPNTKKTEYETNLSQANVSRITERLQVMIFELNSLDESREFILDNVTGYIENRTVYDEKGKATLYYRGTAMGFVQYSSYPKKGHMPFPEERYYKYECNINNDKNCIIDIAVPKPGRIESMQGLYFVTDTVRDFIIVPKDKIILSKADYELLQRAVDGTEYGKRYILYRYE